MKSRLLGALVGALLLAAAAAPQAPASGPERRVFAVSVVDAYGNPVPGLTAANFLGEYRGQPVRILSAAEDLHPRRIVVLVDTSSSMQRGKAWSLAWTAAKDVVMALAPDNELVLMTVAEKVYGHAVFSRHSPAELSELVAQAEATAKTSGRANTALFDGMIKALHGFPPSGFADVLWVISDMADRSSLADGRDVELELARSHVRAYVTWLQSEEEWRRLRQGNLVRKRLAGASGGLSFDLKGDKPERNTALVGSLCDSIRRVYRVEVEFPRSIDKAREWELEVVGADGKKLKDVVVAYPRLLPLTEPAPRK